MHVTIIDSIYLSCIRNYIAGYQNVSRSGYMEGCGGLRKAQSASLPSQLIRQLIPEALRAPNTAPLNPCEVDMASVACLAFPT